MTKEELDVLRGGMSALKWISFIVVIAYLDACVSSMLKAL